MEEEKPDLVITDLMMTSLDSGFSFAAQHQGRPALRGHPRDHRHLGLERPGPRLPASLRPRTWPQMHVDAYFDKPLDPARLLAKIGELLRPGQRAGRRRPAGRPRCRRRGRRGRGAAEDG